MGLLDILRASKIKQENDELKAQIALLNEKMNQLGVTEYFETKQKIEQMNLELDKQIKKGNVEIASNNEIIAKLRE